jgi:hypothetical protein
VANSCLGWPIEKRR